MDEETLAHTTLCVTCRNAMGRPPGCSDVGIGVTKCSSYKPLDKAESAVDHPSHYNASGVEVIDAIEAWFDGTDFHLGNAIKYIARARHKGKFREDLKKAIWYIHRALFGKNDDELIEELAALQYDVLMRWTHWMFIDIHDRLVVHEIGCGCDSCQKVRRWSLMREVPYADAPERQKAVCRVFVRDVFKLLEEG